MDATEIYFFLRTAHTIDFRQSACRSWLWTGIQSATGIGLNLGLANSPDRRRSGHVAPFETVRRACPVDLKLYNGSQRSRFRRRHKTRFCLAGVGRRTVLAAGMGPIGSRVTTARLRRVHASFFIPRARSAARAFAKPARITRVVADNPPRWRALRLSQICCATV